jgi:hypothetical protein
VYGIKPAARELGVVRDILVEGDAVALRRRRLDIAGAQHEARIELLSAIVLEGARIVLRALLQRMGTHGTHALVEALLLHRGQPGAVLADHAVEILSVRPVAFHRGAADQAVETDIALFVRVAEPQFVDPVDRLVDLLVGGGLVELLLLLDDVLGDHVAGLSEGLADLPERGPDPGPERVRGCPLPALVRGALRRWRDGGIRAVGEDRH